MARLFTRKLAAAKEILKSGCPMPVPPSKGPTERRTNRTSDPLVALSRLLEATRLRTGASTLALADDMGICIAGAGEASLCEELAARGPLALEGKPVNDTIPCRLDVVERTMIVRRLRIDGIEVFLCAEAPHPVDVTDAEDGSRRILEGRRRSAR
jgi:hypothetical protein